MAGINDLIQSQPNPNSLPPAAAMGLPPSAGAPLPPASPVPSPAAALPPGASGAAVAPAGAPTGAQQMASPAQVAEIKKLMGTVQNANSKLVTGSLVDRNKMTVMRKDLMMKLFDIMKQAGVDPANPMSVKSFLEQLDQQDPDLLAIFEQAFQGLASNPLDQSGQAPQAPMPGGDQGADQTGAPAAAMAPGQAPGGDMPTPAAPDAGGGANLMDRFQTLNRMGQ